MKQIFLMFLGIIIAVMSLEILLQTSSFVIICANKITNKQYINTTNNLSKKDFIKILCIGESTTFAQYPKQLVDYLNKHINKDFVVIDCGIPGTNIRNTAERINKQINFYKPDIVISMMGVNDAVFNDKTVYRKYPLKIIELFMLIKRHIENIVITKLYAQDSEINYSAIVDNYFETGEQPKILIDIVKRNPNDIKAVESLVCLYRMRKDYLNVEKYANLFFQYNPNSVNTAPLFMLTDTYIQQEKYDLAKNLILKTILNDNLPEEQKNKYLSDVVESYLFFSTIEQTTDYYNLLISNKVQTSVLDYLYKYLKVNNIDVNYYNYINKYKNTVKAPDFNTQEIKQYYLFFANQVINANVIYICMGYPTIPIENFKIFFKDTDLINKILFVSNEHNFKKVLKNKQYYEIFKDNFGGTFGHCTEYGNEVIARNVGKTVIEIVN